MHAFFFCTDFALVFYTGQICQTSPQDSLYKVVFFFTWLSYECRPISLLFRSFIHERLLENIMLVSKGKNGNI